MVRLPPNYSPLINNNVVAADYFQLGMVISDARSSYETSRLGGVIDSGSFCGIGSSGRSVGFDFPVGRRRDGSEEGKHSTTWNLRTEGGLTTLSSEGLEKQIQHNRRKFQSNFYKIQKVFQPETKASEMDGFEADVIELTVICAMLCSSSGEKLLFRLQICSLEHVLFDLQDEVSKEHVTASFVVSAGMPGLEFASSPVIGVPNVRKAMSYFLNSHSNEEHAIACDDQYQAEDGSDLETAEKQNSLCLDVRQSIGTSLFFLSYICHLSFFFEEMFTRCLHCLLSASSAIGLGGIKSQFVHLQFLSDSH